ncbi:MAG: hypothetical protein HUU38_24230 [Anaerolineales bacterium]|nr:hypothetical protein [Anaerolineales bacterium]
MTTLSLSDILDDIQVAEQGLRKFERRYWISSDHFIELYSQGLLDDGENLEDFSQWSGYYKLRKKRLAALDKISSDRVTILRRKSSGETVHLLPAEPMIQVG